MHHGTVSESDSTHLLATLAEHVLPRTAGTFVDTADAVAVVVYTLIALLCRPTDKGNGNAMLERISNRRRNLASRIDVGVLIVAILASPACPTEGIKSCVGQGSVIAPDLMPNK